MPLSLILYLDTEQDPPPDFLGRESQAWFLRTVQGLAPRLSRSLHDGDGHKPYTVSDLYALPAELRLKHAARYAVRITALNDALEALLAGPFLKYLPEKARLWYLDLNVKGYAVSSAESPWAGRTSYRKIAELARSLGNTAAGAEAETAPQPWAEEIELSFLSPTGFRSSGEDIAEPVPSLVFRGCWQKWNRFAPADLVMEDDLPRFVEDCVLVRWRDELAARRIVFAGGKRGGSVGFTGTVRFSILPPALAGAWAESWHSRAAQLRALALYAFYCGVGHHATIGLGQALPRLEAVSGENGL